MFSRNVTRLGIGVALSAGLCLVLGFFPTHGAPQFRYTGSAPNLLVWNLGWPIATMIYDPRTGLHVGPFAYVLFPMIILLGITAIGFVLLARQYQRSE